MQGLLVIAAPVLLILFALSMERIEQHLRRLTMQRQDIQEFFETHTAADIRGGPSVEVMAFRAPVQRSADTVAAIG